MNRAAAKPKLDLEAHYQARIEPLWRKAPFVLRITEWNGYPAPVLAIKQRWTAGGSTGPDEEGAAITEQAPRGNLVERGHLCGEAQRRCLPVLRAIVASVHDDLGVPLELQKYLSAEGLRLRVNLPLDDDAGAKTALICRLQERVTDVDRTELIARRVARFTREEAVYWLSRITSFGEDANRWAVTGLRVMLGGQPNDPGVQRMLEQLRS